MPAEVSSNLERFDGVRYGKRADGETVAEMMANTRGNYFGPEAKRRIILGTHILSAGFYDAYYATAQKVRTILLQELEAAFSKVDILLCPTSVSSGFKLGEKIDDPMSMYQNDIATIPANLAGIPALSLPSGIAENNLPSAIQVLGWQREDTKVFAVSQIIEKIVEGKMGDKFYNFIPKGTSKVGGETNV
jgi:aspartyl-tRNA(Asn)/glutamyl-tRNA(Gln) amidotransferase subunit A